MKTNPTRTFALTREVDQEARTVALACSSEEPYRRWWGVEILDHAPESVDLTRLGDGRHPLLLGHDWDKQIGVVESVEVSPDRKLRAVARFSRGALGNEIMQDVADGIRGLVSIGYTIDEMQEERMCVENGVDVLKAIRTLTFQEFEAEMRARHGADFDFTRGAADAALANSDDLPTFRITRWSPHEVSIVPIPADATVGVGRAAGAVAPVAAAPQPATLPPVSIPQEKTMSDIQVTDHAAEEKARVTAIRDTAKAYARYGAESIALEYIAEGKSLAEFQNAIMAKMATTATPAAATAPDLGLTGQETRSYSLFRAISALADGRPDQAPFELECHRAIEQKLGRRAQSGRSIFVPFEVQKRDMTSAGASGSNYLVGTNNLASAFVDILRNRSVTMKMGATRLSGLSGNVTIPKQTAAATAYWLANEATQITESQPTFGQIALSPKNVGAYTEISRQLSLQSAPDAEMLVMRDLAAVVALAADSAVLAGTGADGQPTGIAATSGIGAVIGTSLAHAGVLEFQTDVAGGNALVNGATMGYVTTPAVAALMMQRFTNTTYGERPLWDGNILDGKMAGFGAMSSNQVASANMFFGDWSQAVIGEWGVLEIEANPYADFKAGLIGIRAFYTMDVGVRIASAFSRAHTIT
jgi:HK97 family phage major capsid protein